MAGRLRSSVVVVVFLFLFFRARLQLSEPRIEYHQFERVKCEIESGKTGFFIFDRLQKFFFIFAWVILRVPDFFVILKAGLHVRRKLKRKPRVPFSCACIVPVHNWPMLVLMFVFASHV